MLCQLRAKHGQMCIHTFYSETRGIPAAICMATGIPLSLITICGCYSSETGGISVGAVVYSFTSNVMILS
jgi:hypothetical protein